MYGNFKEDVGDDGTELARVVYGGGKGCSESDEVQEKAPQRLQTVAVQAKHRHHPKALG